ncbi:hypothetical protein [Pelomicrobium sp. G1]|uniref:hypothetical protein n=1 Tax=unclassified Pelomicrobium TaxID=2815318 RepID=UPI0021DCFEE7|nr:MAG: hypothetical protein KatS3mg123_2074 [Burkholderiales bacterium]
MDKRLLKTLPAGVIALAAWGVAPAWADAGVWDHFERMRRVSDCVPAPGHGLEPMGGVEKAARGVKGQSGPMAAAQSDPQKMEALRQPTDGWAAGMER